MTKSDCQDFLVRNDSFLEELNQGGMNLRPSIISVKLICELAHNIWGLSKSYLKSFTIFLLSKDDSLESQPYIPALGSSRKLLT